MNYFEKSPKFTRIKRNTIGSVILSTYSFMKLIFLCALLTLLAGCIYGKAAIQVKANNKQSLLNISVANVQVINHQLIITGTGLSRVTAFKIKNGASTTNLQIESKTNTSIVANTLSNVSFAVGTIFDFVLSNANAASTFQVTFVNSNNSITAAMLTSMGATKGQVMKYNGASWVASSITNAQTYLGTWDATANTPDLTLPSSMPGDYYIVSVAGTFDSIPYAVGDWIISDGYNWQKVANSAVVVSTFNGRRGIVTLVPGDYVSLRNGSGKLPGSSLNDLDDLNIVTPANGSVLKYDTATSKWIVGVDNSGAGAYAGTPNRAVATDGAGALTTSSTTATELGYVAGVTSSIQTQLGAKLGTALANGNVFVGNGSGVATGVSLSGDATLLNTGVLTLKNTGTAGTYTSVTTDAQGRVTAGSNPAVAAITALTGDVTASGTGSVTATIAANAVTTGKINDGTILPSDLDFTGTNIGTSGLVIRNLTGGFTPLVCGTVGYVPTWTVTGFTCQAITPGSSLSSLTAATATNTIDNSNFSQIWNWTTATTESLMTFASNAMTTGSILNLTTSNGSVNSTNGLLNVANTGASTSGVLARFQANSTAGSGMTMLTNGNVGVGVLAPGSALDVKGTLRLSGSTSGYVGFAPAAAAGSVTYTLPSTQGTAGQVLSTDGVASTPTLSWITPSAPSAVTSVNTQTGAVVLTTSDVAEGTNLYSTNARTIASTLTGFSAGANSTILAADTVLGALQKTQGQINAREPAITAGTTAQYLRGDKSLSTFSTDAINSALTGLSTATSTAVTATDSILVGVGKLQGQVSANTTSLATKADLTNITQTITAGAVTGLGAPSAGSDATNKTYVDTVAGVWTVGSGNAYRTTGNVGIGTTTPGSKLEVNGGNAAVDLSVFAGGNAPTTLSMGRTSAESQIGSAAGANQFFAGTAAGDGVIRTVNSANSVHIGSGGVNPTLTVTSSRAGVGTTTPGSTLDVKGTLRLSGSTSGYVGFAPAAAAGTITYTLPSTQGSAGQFLTTDGVASTPTLTWASPAGAGTVTSVTSANADIAIATTTSTPVLTLNSGTGANQIVKLNASSQLPAVDGSLLTSLNPTNFSVVVPMDKGGTGANITPVNGGVIYSNATTMASTAAGTAGQILRSAGAAAPVWSTATYPSTVGVNNLLFGSAANVVGEITTANSSVLTTNASGVPAWSTVANTKTLLGLGTAATKDTGVTSGTIPILGTVTAGISMCTNSIAGFDCNTPIPTGASLSGLTAATATNTIDNLNFAQAWNWTTATTQSLMTLASNALTTGSILNLSSSNATLNSTNGLLNVANTGASTSGVLARFQANSTVSSGMTMLTNGNVGVGTTTPNNALQVAGTTFSNSGFISQNGGYRVNSGSANYPALYMYAPNNGSGRIVFANGQSNAAWDTYLVRTGVNELTLSSDAAAGAATLNVTGSANFATTTGNVGIRTSTPAFPLDVNGNIRVNNKITSASTETILEQTGDALGATRLRLQNRTGLNGALFENAALDLVDFGFLGSSGAQSNLRYEHRGIGLLNSNNIDGEFQFRYGTQGGSAGTSYFASGPSATIISTGNVGVGTTAPGYKLHVVGAGGATIGYFSDGTATCSITPATAGNISCSSDERLKKNIEFFSDLRSLDKILKLKTVTYEWKDIDNGRHTGFIAQDVEKIAPEFVINGKDGFKQVSYAGFIPWITGAIKALYGEFKIVVARVLSLEEKDVVKGRAIASINAKADKLESDNLMMKNKFEAEHLTLKKNFEALKKENELMKAKLDRIEKFIEKKSNL